MILTVDIQNRTYPTNGDIIKALFPDTKIITQYTNPFGETFIAFTLNNGAQQVNLNWWNESYKVKKEDNNYE